MIAKVKYKYPISTKLYSIFENEIRGFIIIEVNAKHRIKEQYNPTTLNADKATFVDISKMPPAVQLDEVCYTLLYRHKNGAWISITEYEHHMDKFYKSIKSLKANI